MDVETVAGVKSGAEAPRGKEGKQASAPGDAVQDKRLRQACTEFESLFLYNLFKEMRRTIPKSGLLPSAPGKDTYEMMFNQKVAEDLSKRGEGIGLQKILYEQLRRR
ncbi:MAG: rod-binding protein [Syntrophales bacterium]